MLCFDFDLNNEARLAAPTFYGYIPTYYKSRLVAFTTMCMFSSCHLAMKFFGIALLAVSSNLYVGFFLGADMLFFFFFKSVRSDLR